MKKSFSGSQRDNCEIGSISNRKAGYDKSKEQEFIKAVMAGNFI